ncbi:MAG TPA: F0F1 ATP synthase subunit gamma [Bryobacteraceae bacterium]|nr:F0F1 ATP synthase subunit gamma [Bryobacteraceae bacterium]
MSRRRGIESTLRSLTEIRDILNAMKNIARTEVNRLGRFLETQRRVVESLQSAAADFRSFYPQLFESAQVREVDILLGSERGFCGDFNVCVLEAFKQHRCRSDCYAVTVGTKLQARLGDSLPQSTFLENASVADEIEETMSRIMEAVSIVRRAPDAALRLTVFHHHQHGESAKMTVLDLFEQAEVPLQRFHYPPALQLDPAVFAGELMQQYLFARLYELLCSSLLTENQARVEHLESAVQRLDRRSAELLRRRDALREEEITEEIEVIMLSSEASV